MVSPPTQDFPLSENQVARNSFSEFKPVGPVSPCIHAYHSMAEA